MARRRSDILTRSCMVVLLSLLAGCATDTPMDTSLPVTHAQAEAILRAMPDYPKPLIRPVVVLGGYMDPGDVETHLVRCIERHTGDKRVLGIAFGDCDDFAQCRRRVLAMVSQRFGVSADGQWTVPIDVVAFSMGGVVARDAAAPPEVARQETSDNDTTSLRLDIVRLFTISTPHRGAQLAFLAPWDPLARDMEPGSPFMARLTAALKNATYQLYPYVKLDDPIVGSERAAPDGRVAWWVSNGPFMDAHNSAPDDPRILADILRRLRHEPPLSSDPPSPLP